jgi:hypothetical protein
LKYKVDGDGERDLFFASVEFSGKGRDRRDKDV